MGWSSHLRIVQDLRNEILENKTLISIQAYLRKALTCYDIRRRVSKGYQRGEGLHEGTTCDRTVVICSILTDHIFDRSVNELLQNMYMHIHYPFGRHFQWATSVDRGIYLPQNSSVAIPLQWSLFVASLPLPNY